MLGRRSYTALGLGVCLLVAACGDENGTTTVASSEPEDTEETTIELFSWWLEGGERDALYAILDMHEEQHPDATVINVAEDNADEARETLTARMADGVPPDTFQANIGADLLQWLEQDDASLLPLDDLAEDQGWFDVLPPELLQAASFDGSLYGVPLNVHRINALYYNKRLFEEHGLTPPGSIEELNELVVTIAADEDIQTSNSGGVAPLALGNRWDWTLSLMTFEAVLPAVAGADYYERFWSGNAGPTDTEITAALNEILFLYCGSAPEDECNGYFNADIDDVTWGEGVRKLVSGSAAMAVMGDWAKGYLEDQRLVADEDFGVVPFPGSDGTYVFTADTFPLPKNAEAEEATRQLLMTFGSIEGQVAFNSLKGSIPARTDIDPQDYPEDFDAVDARTMRDFREGKRVLAMSGLIPGDFRQGLAAALKESMHAGSIEAVQTYLTDNYDSLK